MGGQYLLASKHSPSLKPKWGGRIGRRLSAPRAACWAPCIRAAHGALKDAPTEPCKITPVGGPMAGTLGWGGSFTLPRIISWSFERLKKSSYQELNLPLRPLRLVSLQYDRISFAFVWPTLFYQSSPQCLFCLATLPDMVCRVTLQHRNRLASASERFLCQYWSSPAHRPWPPPRRTFRGTNGDLEHTTIRVRVSD